MEHGTTLLAVFHILVAVLLVTIVLLQDSKGGGVGGAFGGGSSQTLFGATGAANFMVKVTRILAIIFMLTCFGLTLIVTRGNSHSVVDTLPLNGPASNPPITMPTAPDANPNQPAHANTLPETGAVGVPAKPMPTTPTAPAQPATSPGTH